MKNGFIGSWGYFGEEVFRELADPMEVPMPPTDVFVEIGILLVRAVEKRFLRCVEALQNEFAAILLIEDDQAAGEDPLIAENKQRFQQMSKDIAEILKSFKQPFEAADDAEHAYQALDALHYTNLPNFVIEADVLTFLEATYGMLKEEYDPAWAEEFSRLVGNFIEKFHLPYKLCPPFRLMPLIAGQALRIYELIEQNSGPHGDHPELWQAFEEAYHQLVRNGGDRKTPIHKITSYLEAIAADKLDIERDSLGELLKSYENKRVFPHRGTITGSLDKLYGFTSNYPGIRHAGRPASRNRDLSEDDVTMLSLLLFVWSGYLHTLPVEGRP